MSATRLLSYLKALFRRGRVENDLSEELQFHLQQEIQKNIAAGMTPEHAGYAALRSFGGVEQVKEKCRDMRRVRWIEDLWRDARFGLKMLFKNPGFTATALISLAIGIGANTAIFTAMNAVLWRLLPVRDPQQLVKIIGVRVDGTDLDGIPSTFVEELRRSSVFSDAFSVSNDGLSLSVGDRAERIMGEVVSPNYFSALGVAPLLGQSFSQEVQSGAWKPEVVLAYDFWQRRFSGDPKAIGKTIHLNTYPCTIVGVTPPSFFGTEVGSSPELRLPLLPRGQSLGQIDLANNSHVRVIDGFGRLKPGITRRQAEAATDVLFQHYLRETAARNVEGIELRHVRLLPAERGTSRLRSMFAGPLALLFVAVGLLLLTACANVANLLLAKSNARHREIAVRLAIGAGRARLLRQLLTESLLLALIGGALGIALAFWATHAILFYLPQTHLRIVLDMSPDLRALTFALCLATMTGLLFGAVPAMQSTKVAVADALKSDSTASIGSTRRQGWLDFRRGLVGWQVALSLLLLIGAGLLMRSLQNLKDGDYGFRPERVLLFTMKPQREIYSPAQIRRLMSEVLQRVGDLPGVHSAGWAESGPLDGRGLYSTSISTAAGQSTRTIIDSTGPSFLETIGLPVLAGRDVSASDRPETPAVVIVNDVLSKILFRDESPIGHTVLLGPSTATQRTFQVIGVVPGSRYHDLHKPSQPVAYLAIQQQTPYMPTLHVRTIVPNVASVISGVRQEFEAADREVPVFNIKTLEGRIDDSLARERLIAALSGLFGVIALMLAAIGLYGVITYNVTHKTREIGIRMALGASRTAVISGVLREALIPGLLGICVGLLMAVVAARLLSTFLFGVAATDPIALGVSTAIIATVAFIAGLIPAWRASRIGPMVALRCQ